MTDIPTETEIEPEPESDIILLEFTYSIDHRPEETITFYCPNYPGQYSWTKNTEATSGKWVNLQGYDNIKINDSLYLTYNLITYHEKDIASLNLLQLKAFLIENPEAIHFDIELIENDSIYRNQFYNIAYFEDRNIVVEQEEINVSIIDTESFKCTYPRTMINANVEYSGKIKTESQFLEKVITFNFKLKLDDWP